MSEDKELITETFSEMRELKNEMMKLRGEMKEFMEHDIECKALKSTSCK